MNLHDALINTVVDKLLIGGLIVVAGFYLNRALEVYRTQQSRLIEGFKDGLALTRETAKEQRVALGDLAKEISSCYQAMEWFLWKATFKKGFSQSDIDEYDRCMNALLPQVARAQVVVAAFDIGRWQEVRKAVADVTHHDKFLATIYSDYETADSGRQAVIKKDLADAQPSIKKAKGDFIDNLSSIAHKPS